MISSTVKIKDVLGVGTNRYGKIRKLARDKCGRDKKLNNCQKCGYNKHVEVSHIKAIRDFDINEYISIVNDSSNLMVLCPNCHWEFDNMNKINRSVCPDCNGRKYRWSSRCRKCSDILMLEHRRSKSKCPSKEKLLELVNLYPYMEIGKMFSVSGNAVKKWYKSNNIILENRIGYWAKVRCKANKIGGP